MLTYYVKYNAVNLLGTEIECTQECKTRYQAFKHAKLIRKYSEGSNIRVYEYDTEKDEPMKLIRKYV